MNSGSYASYRAAASPEALGEPDDDSTTPDPGPPIAARPDGWTVEWFAPVVCRTMTGQLRTIIAPVRRCFARDRHGDPEAAARRWATAMARRYRWANLIECWGDETIETVVRGSRP